MHDRQRRGWRSRAARGLAQRAGRLGGMFWGLGASRGPWARSLLWPPTAARAGALTVHAGGPGSGGARDLPLPARAASRLPGNRPPRLAAVAVQRHNLTGAGGQLTCKRGTDGAEWTRLETSRPSTTRVPTWRPPAEGPRGTSEPPRRRCQTHPAKPRRRVRPAPSTLRQRGSGSLAWATGRSTCPIPATPGSEGLSHRRRAPGHESGPGLHRAPCWEARLAWSGLGLCLDRPNLPRRDPSRLQVMTPWVSLASSPPT